MRIIILALYMALFIVACGGSSAPSTTKEPVDQTKIGVFIDAPVKGLAYTSLPSGKKGITNEKGEFEYIDGDIVSFNMGSIELGNAIPDKDKNVKVTQLKEAILVAQLLQVLDTDADENKIDVSDIVIPEVIENAIEEKLNGTDGKTADNEDSAENNNIISEEQFAVIKQKNPQKLTLQQRTKVVTKEEVIEHVEQQIGEKGLTFSSSELENQFLIESRILNIMDGVIFGFSEVRSPVRQIDIKSGGDQSVSDIPWQVDKQGSLAVGESDENCTVSKVAENDLIDVSVICGRKEKGKVEKPSKFLASFIKPKPLSANDFTGKSFKVSEETTITFRNDGTFTCNDTEICSYEDHPSYKNTVLIIDDSEATKRHTLVLLIKGSVTKGKLIFIEFKEKDETISAESEVEVNVLTTADGTLKNLFDTKNKDEDKGDSNDNNSNKKNEIEEAKEEAKEIKDPKEDYNKDTDNHSDSGKQKENSDNNSGYKDNSDSGTHNPAYIPFTQEMISGSTFYSVGNEDDDEGITIFFGANKKGQAWFSLSDSNTSPDVTFDYLIDNEGYIIVSNTKEKGVVSDDTPAIGLLSEPNNALKACWGSSSVSDISDFCKDDDIKIWYKIKADAEAALKQHKNNDRDEDTDDNSDSIDNPNAGTQNPTYTPFTQEMISGKTFYALATYFNPNNIPIYSTTTIQFDPLNGKNTARGRSQYIYDENLSDIDTTFKYGFLDGFLIFSNRVQSGSEPETITHKLLDKTDQFLKVCSTFTEIRKEGNDECTIELWYYNKKDAEEASKE